MRKLIAPIRDKIPQILFIFLFLLIQVYGDLTLPQYTADIVNIGIQNTNFQFIIDTGLVMLLMVAISALATIGVSYFSSRVASGYAKDLRKIIYSKVLRFSNHELNNISRSSLITRTTNDVNQIQGVLGFVFTTLIFASLSANLSQNGALIPLSLPIVFLLRHTSTDLRLQTAHSAYDNFSLCHDNVPL